MCRQDTTDLDFRQAEVPEFGERPRPTGTKSGGEPAFRTCEWGHIPELDSTSAKDIPNACHIRKSGRRARPRSPWTRRIRFLFIHHPISRSGCHPSYPGGESRVFSFRTVAATGRNPTGREGALRISDRLLRQAETRPVGRVAVESRT